MKVISVINQKGGVGKSSAVSTLMSYFTKQGYRVLGIDTDSQGHMAKITKCQTEDMYTILELLKNVTTFEETVQHTKFGDVIAADNNLHLAMPQFSTMPDFIYSVLDILEKVEDKYDYVFIDCPASISVLTMATLIASNYVLIPTEVELLPLDGVQQLASTIKSVKHRVNKDLEVLGVFCIKYNARLKLTKKFDKVLEKSAKEIFNTEIIPVRIRQSVDMPTSQALQMSIFDYKPNSPVAQDYKQLGEWIYNKIN